MSHWIPPVIPEASPLGTSVCSHSEALRSLSLFARWSDAGEDLHARRFGPSSRRQITQSAYIPRDGDVLTPDSRNSADTSPMQVRSRHDVYFIVAIVKG